MAMYPNLFQYDTGQVEDLSQASGLGVRNAGLEQNRLRRNAIMQRNAEQAQRPGAFNAPLRGLFHGLGLGGSPEWDAYFGAMQGKENAVQSQGGRLDVDLEGSWGTGKREPLFRPTWDPRYQSSALEGLRRYGSVNQWRGGR